MRNVWTATYTTVYDSLDLDDLIGMAEQVLAIYQGWGMVCEPEELIDFGGTWNIDEWKGE